MEGGEMEEKGLKCVMCMDQLSRMSATTVHCKHELKRIFK